MTTSPWLIGGAALAASYALSFAVLRYARRKRILDLPSERSSHAEPTPRGGGLGLVLVVLGAVGLLHLLGRLDARFAIGLIAGGALVAGAGWIDDVRGLSPSRRLLAHTVAAVWVVAWLGGMPALSVGAGQVVLGWMGSLLAVVGIVWAINLYNFMDGIDGLAAGEALVVGAAAAALLAGRDPSLAGVAAAVAGAAAGFLPFNWQRARIFMGDVGSGFLGFAFGTVALAAENRGSLPAVLWLLLLGVFFVDATITLVRRMLRGETWYAAHRSHAYQRAVHSGWSHARVSGAVILGNLILAALAAVGSRAPSRVPLVAGAGAVLLAGLYVAVERRLPMGGAPRPGRMENPL